MSLPEPWFGSHGAHLTFVASEDFRQTATVVPSPPFPALTKASLRAAAALVDAKSREALAGLGTLSEARQLLFASLLLADQLVDEQPAQAAVPDPRLAESAESLAARLEALAETLESETQNA